MPSVFSSVLLALSVLSPALARSWEPANDITWIERSQELLVKLDTPGFPLHTESRDTAANGETAPSPSTAFVFKLALDDSGRTLLLNGQAIFPLRDPNRPADIIASQVFANISAAEFQTFEQDYMVSPHRLDYDRLEHTTNDSYRYYTTLSLDLMGAQAPKLHNGVQPARGFLDDSAQKTLQVTLAERFPFHSSPGTYRIENVELVDRDPFYRPRRPDNISACSLCSWRCADISEEPYYRFVWRDYFDAFGRIGSGRHLFQETLFDIWQHWQDFGMIYIFTIPSVLCAALSIYLAVTVYKNGLLDRRALYQNWVRYHNRWTHHPIDTYVEEGDFLIRKDHDDSDRDLEAGEVRSNSIGEVPPTYNDALVGSPKPLPPTPAVTENPVVGEGPPGYDIRMKLLPPSPHGSLETDNRGYFENTTTEERPGSFEEEQYGQYHSSHGDAGEA
ncbi:uncharacterized protein K452DRAFT_281999 [Aplosporella prunicola CBS 121167]|uniref:Uncharacterized protein n=1 Tax=Aplosporella prunicola CBS 121167 TaxID=1176127 RepID=A0A6A6BUX0_9PEZI|nr:uncharacterized protein K452DRAFT_281999 [Aplosporella prunicola CBS 121167]KAF2147014.1 hypothetical protein K452DRAFT_281999 [Aplosporella prunicola CBS 121167]